MEQPIMKKSWILASTCIFCFMQIADLHAGPTWIMDGKCTADSRSKSGKMADDLRVMPGKPIACDGVIVSRFKNNGWFIQFAEKRGSTNPVGFVSSGDGSMNRDGLFEIPLVRVYPPQPLRAAGENRVVFPAEGVCFVNSREISKAKQLSCTSNTEGDGYRLVISVTFDVTKVSYEVLPD